MCFTGGLVPGDALDDHHGLAAFELVVPAHAVTVDRGLHARGGLALLLAECLHGHPASVLYDDDGTADDREADAAATGLEFVQVRHVLLFLQIRIWNLHTKSPKD